MTETRGRPQRSLAELVPENAPFDEEQRAWLNGFLAGLLGLGSEEGRPVESGIQELGPEAASEVAPATASSAAPASAPSPWADAALPVERRLELARGEPLERRMLAAVAQLDCGQCGYSCRGYAHAIAGGNETDTTLCAPGGQPVARALQALLVEQARASGTPARAPVVSAGAGQRSARGAELEPPVSAVKLVPGRALIGLPAERRDAQRVRVKSQRRLTLADAGSEVREIVLDLTGTDVQYRAGDSLAIFPHNDPDLVRSLLRALGARGQEIVSTPSGPSEVWRCLLESVDITHLRTETVQLFAKEAAGGQDGRALDELLQQGAPSGFDLLDLIASHPSTRPAISDIVASLGPLSPRLYAIASSPSTHPDEVHLAVRVVRAERGGRERKGVASNYLADGVFRGDELDVYVHANERLAPLDERSGPLILLGFGTGLARHRAILEELEVRGRRGSTWLILASAYEGDETLYEAELKAWARVGVLEHLDVIKVGSRGRRAGPQDVLRKRGRRVATWLERGALVYACGEGKSSSALLADTLIEVLGRHGKMTRNEASDFVQVLRREGRYLEEVY